VQSDPIESPEEFLDPSASLVARVSAKFPQLATARRAARRSGLNSQLHSARRGSFSLSRSSFHIVFESALLSRRSTFSRKDLYAFSGNPAAQPRSPRTSLGNPLANPNHCSTPGDEPRPVWATITPLHRSMRFGCR